MTYLSNYLDQYKTGKQLPVKHVIHTNAGRQTIDAFGTEYQAGIGDLVLRLLELTELQRKKKTWLRRFFLGRLGLLEIELEILHIRDALNQANVNWVSDT